MKTILAFFLLLLGFPADEALNVPQEASPIIYQPLTYDYNTMWIKIQEAEKKGLTKDALKLTEELYAQAKAEKNGVQITKALLHIMKYNGTVEENADSLNMIRIEKEIAAAEFPTQQILQSIQAEMYMQYYDNNRWQIRGRTKTDKFANTDFQTWDLTRIVEEIYRLHTAAIAPKNELQKINIKEFKDLLEPNIAAKSDFRPTLYDLLAHRALNFFKRSDYDLTRPAFQFNLDAKQGLSDADDFLKIAFDSPDSTSKDLHAAHIYQHLLGIHTNNPAARIDVDLSRLHWAKEHATGEDKDTLFLRTLEHLSQKYENNEAVSYVYAEMMQIYQQRAGNYNPKDSDKYRWDYVKAISLANEMKKRFPTANGTQRCKDLENNILNKSVGFEIENITAPNQPSLAHISYRNHFQYFVRIVPLSKDLETSLQNVYDAEKIAAILAKQTPLKSWEVKFPTETDHHHHSTEIILPAMPQGRYVLLMSDNVNFTFSNHILMYEKWNITPFIVSHIKHQGEKYIEYLVNNRITGKPESGVAMDLSIQYYDYSKQKYVESSRKGSTDEQGICKMDLTNVENPQTNYSLSLKAKKGDFYYESSEGFNTYESREDRAQYTEFFIDRGIYRPGQTIYFKGICLEKVNNKTQILPNKKATIIFYDANYQVREQVELTTNDYGSFSGTFTAPTSGLLGQMHLEIKDGSNSSKYLMVEEYKRPKFEVTMKEVEGSYKLGDKVTVKGNAMGFAGNAIDGAEVKYRVLRQAHFPYWGYYFWWRPQPSAPSMEITNGSVKTDSEGNFSIHFTAIPDALLSAKDKPEFSYSVMVDVVDITGETHSTQSSVRIGYIALSADISLNEVIDNAKTDSVTVSTKNLNGVFEPAKGTIEIYALETPAQWFRKRPFAAPDVYTISEADFRKNFPYDVYKNENDKRNWKKGAKLSTINFDTSKDKEYALSGLNGAKQGQYVVEMATKDMFGNEIKTTHYVLLTDKKSDKLPIPTPLTISFDKMLAEPGETITATLATSEETAYLVWTVEQKGKQLDRQYVTLTGKSKQIAIPVKEEYRGGISVCVASVSQNESHAVHESIEIPWSNKELKLEWSTFRNKLLPGAKEEWRLKISGPKSEKVAAEMVAAMYDASLDAFASNDFAIRSLNPYYYRMLYVESSHFGKGSAYSLASDWNKYSSQYKGISYDALNLFGFYFGYGERRGGELDMLRSRSQSIQPMPMAAPTMAAGGKSDAFEAEPQKFMADAKKGAIDSERSASYAWNESTKEEAQGGEGKSGKDVPKKEVQVRKNLQETAFFFPNLMTNEKGEIILSFTMPEALTKWKFLGFAHTKDLKTGYLTGNTVTQKDLMIMPNAPRFLRVGDNFSFSAKIANLSATDVSGTAHIIFTDAISGKEITDLLVKGNKTLNFTAKKGQSALAEWTVLVPENVQAVGYKVIAEAGEFSDGEENALPVVLNQMLVTETAALWVRGKSSKIFKIPNLINSADSKTLKHQQFTLEITSNPAWYAIQALPYLMEYPHECTEQLFSRYYANTMASHIATTTPRVQQVFEQWRNAQGGNKDALLSNLSKNQELKSALLEETPWVLEANNETERKKRVGLLFDLNKMALEKESAEQKLLARQNGNGSFSWFPGMKESPYITEIVALGLGHTQKLGVKASEKMQNMAEKAVLYLDGEMDKQYDRMKRDKVDLEKYQLSYSDIQYLYMRSFYAELKVGGSNKTAYDYFWKQAKKYALEQKSNYMQGMLALALHRGGETTLAKQLINALRQNAVTTNEEMGMYWKGNAGYWWYEAPIETQALLIEAFAEVDNDMKSVEDMKVWLLKNKQTNDWKTTRATTEACNALFLTGDNMLADTEIPEIKLGGKVVDLQAKKVEIEAGTGHFKTTWQASEIKPDMGTITLSKKEKGMAWGGAYWQYFENLDKIKWAATPLSIKKQLFIEKNTATGPKIEPITTTSLKQGDKIVVRIEIRVDRDMEYVHLKDMRAAGFEPTETISTYKYQDGLGYYQSTKDLGTHFFMDYLPKGTYVFEYSLRATHKGDFSNGITTMQSMYAPEFTSHSEGVRVKIE